MAIESKECFAALTEDGQLWEIYQAAQTGGGGITSINGNTNAAQTIAGTAPISVSSTAGTTTVTTSMNTARLLGRTTAGVGVAEEISVGTGLTLSAGTLAISAAGTKTLAVFNARDNQPPAANFATLDTRNSIAILDFDDTTNENAIFLGIVSQGAILTSGLKIRLVWTATTATTGNCVWDVALERMITDIDADSFDTAASATATTNATSGVPNYTEITLTTIDSAVAGDGFRIRITRNATNGSDTMVGDAELIAVEVQQVA